MPSRDKGYRSSPSERPVRSLVNLRDNASTARILNLIAIWEKSCESDEYKDNPFFKNIVLNRAIILKHRLRPNERDLFADERSGATKIILPIDITNLRAGARSFFIGQVGYHAILDELLSLSVEENCYDTDLLEIIDTLPSLDPFLMRERLNKAGFRPARLYFDVTAADTARMFHFTRTELAPLIGLTGASADLGNGEKAGKLAAKILANDSDAELEPLRTGMGMDKAAFDEGIFCWKGFIYYKWTLSDLLPKVRPVSNEIAAIRATGQVSSDEAAYILKTRTLLTKTINQACQTVRATLKIYDDAYRDLTVNGQPMAFRAFLLNAPNLFYELGERLAAIQHIVSFWRFRFPEGRRIKVDAEELSDLLTDFEFSLSFDVKKEAA